MNLTDRECAKLTEKKICPVCQMVRQFDSVISHVSNVGGMRCHTCECIFMVEHQLALDAYNPPGCYFDSVH